MLDILQDFLSQTATPETLAALQEAHQTFDDLGMDTYEQRFEELLMLHDEVDAADTLTSIVNETNDLQRDILRQHDVVLNEDEATTSIYTLFIRGLLDIQNYEDLPGLAQATLLAMSDEEVFAEVMALVTEKSADELLPYIESTGHFLIVRLKELAYASSDTTGFSDIDALDRQRYVDALNNYCSFLGSRDLHTVVMLESGMNVGYPFDVYASRDMDQLPVSEWAKELVAMALISRDGIDNPKSIIQANMERLVDSIDKATEIDIEVNRLILGLTRYGQA